MSDPKKAKKRRNYSFLTVSSVNDHARPREMLLCYIIALIYYFLVARGLCCVFCGPTPASGMRAWGFAFYDVNAQQRHRQGIVHINNNCINLFLHLAKHRNPHLQSLRQCLESRQGTLKT